LVRSQISVSLGRFFFPIIVLVFTVFIEPVYAGDKPAFRGIPGNTIFIELGGTSYFYSFNYERKLFRIGNFCTACRLGVGRIAMSFSSWEMDLAYPFSLYGIWQWGKRWFAEIGPGITYKKHGHKEDELEPVLWRKSTHLTFCAGIRYVGERGLMLRADFTPSWILKYINHSLRNLPAQQLPLAGFSVGFSFGK
jgi:hypothetical protein